MELAGRPTAGLCEPERLSEATPVPDLTLRYELIMRSRRPCPPGRGGGAAAARGEGRLDDVWKNCKRLPLNWGDADFFTVLGVVRRPIRCI